MCRERRPSPCWSVSFVCSSPPSPPPPSSASSPPPPLRVAALSPSTAEDSAAVGVGGGEDSSSAEAVVAVGSMRRAGGGDARGSGEGTRHCGPGSAGSDGERVGQDPYDGSCCGRSFFGDGDPLFSRRLILRSKNGRSGAEAATLALLSLSSTSTSDGNNDIEQRY